MTTDDVRRIQRRLKAIGFSIAVDGDAGAETHAAVLAFKRGYAMRAVGLNRNSTAMGIVFRRALGWSYAHDGRCSDHFHYREFKSKGNGDIKVNHYLVRGLEEYRRHVGHGVTIVSGYRDPAYNAQVGGVVDSQHLWGAACDIPGELSVKSVQALGRFSGIGYSSATGKVIHVDVRHKSGHNGTLGSPSHPTVWKYS